MLRPTGWPSIRTALVRASAPTFGHGGQTLWSNHRCQLAEVHPQPVVAVCGLHVCVCSFHDVMDWVGRDVVLHELVCDEVWVTIERLVTDVKAAE